MAEATKTPAKAQPEPQSPPRIGERDLFGSLRHEIERVFEDFDKGLPRAMAGIIPGDPVQAQASLCFDPVGRHDREGRHVQTYGRSSWR